MGIFASLDLQGLLPRTQNLELRNIRKIESDATKSSQDAAGLHRVFESRLEALPTGKCFGKGVRLTSCQNQFAVARF